MNSFEKSWKKLTQLATQAPAGPADMPFGFATRAVAAWKSSPAETFFNALEGLAWRGVAVAVVIFGGCAAFGYDSLVSAMSGEAMPVGNFLSDLLGL